MLQVGALIAAEGRKINGFVDVPGTDIRLPVTLIAGAQNGSTCLVSAGVHSAEYTSIETANQLAKEIQPKQLRGNLIIVHLLNPSGFAHRTMSFVYEDGKNLNRVFPGDNQGTVAEKIAAAFIDLFQRQAEFYLDLHGGDGFESLTPYVYYTAKAEGYVSQKARQMAQCVNVPYMVGSTLRSGGAYNYAGSLGIPSILLERGCGGVWNQTDVGLYKEDVRNVLRYIGILEDGEPLAKPNPMEVEKVYYENAPYFGCWYPKKSAGDLISAGEDLGEICDYFGELLFTCTAKASGVILYQTQSLCILKDTPMIAYAQLPK